MKIHNTIKTSMRKHCKGLSITLATLLLASSFPVNGGTSLAKSAPATFAAAKQFNFGSPLPLPFPFNKALSASASTFPTVAAAAGSNFRYLINSPRGGDSFGDEPGSVGGTYKGTAFTYEFPLPGVDPAQKAVVILSSRSVSVSCNTFEINGVQIGAALRDHNDSTVWETETAQIPGGVLKATDNKLRIGAMSASCNTSGNLDDFIVANLVIHYIQQ